MNIRVRYRNRLSSFHLTSKFRWGQYFSVKVFQRYELFCWRINDMVWSRENFVQMYKPEFKVYKWDFSAEKSQLTRWIFLSIDHSRTVHNVLSSSTLFMHVPDGHYVKNLSNKLISEPLEIKNLIIYECCYMISLYLTFSNWNKNVVNIWYIWWAICTVNSNINENNVLTP